MKFSRDHVHRRALLLALLKGRVFIGLYVQLNLYDSWEIVPHDNGYIFISVQWHYWNGGEGGVMLPLQAVK